jgi:hypothetical protein
MKNAISRFRPADEWNSIVSGTISELPGFAENLFSAELERAGDFDRFLAIGGVIVPEFLDDFFAFGIMRSVISNLCA